MESVNFATILPELILAAGAMALLMLGVFLRKEQGEFVLGLAILVIIVAGVFVAMGQGTETAFQGSFIVDSFARVMKLLTLTGAAAALLMSIDY